MSTLPSIDAQVEATILRRAAHILRRHNLDIVVLEEMADKIESLSRVEREQAAGAVARVRQPVRVQQRELVWAEVDEGRSFW